MMRNNLYIILSAMLWGITGVFVSVFRDFGITTQFICAARSVVTAVLICLLLLFKNKKLFKVKFKDIWVFVGTGILSFAFFTYCYYVSIDYNGMAVAAILLYTAPVFVSIMSALFFKNSFTKRKTIALIFSFVGCALVSEVLSSELRISTIGILAGLGSGIGYALYTIFSQVAINKGYKSETITFYTFVFASIATVPLSLISKTQSQNGNVYVLLILLAFGLLTGALPYILYTKGLEKTEPSMAAISATVEPIVATSLGVIVLHEQLSLSKSLGVALILISLYVISNEKES